MSKVYANIGSIIVGLIEIAVDDRDFGNLDEVLEDIRTTAANQIRSRNKTDRDRLLADLGTRLKTIINEDELTRRLDPPPLRPPCARGG